MLFVWLFYWAQSLFTTQLNHLGILPRKIVGLVGIVFSPLLHDQENINHILNNSIPIYLLTLCLFYFHSKNAKKIFILNWVLTGTLTWIIAPYEGLYHIGMSGVIYALITYLFITSSSSKNRQLQALSLLIVIVYGSLIWGIFPMDIHISWESHLSGVISGTLLSIIYKVNKPITQVEIKHITAEKKIAKQIIEIQKMHNENKSHIIKYNYIKKEND